MDPVITQCTRFGAIHGPTPLVRTTGDVLELMPEGLHLLNSLSPTCRIVTVFAVGSSRAGKSTLGNALLDGKIEFPTSDGFSAVTEGIDVATLVVDKDTVLVYCDCEGSFHIKASHTNAHSFGPMAVLAYLCTDHLAHVSMGNVDERDLQSLAFLAASASRHTDERKPRLLIIINKPRFPDLASDPTQVLTAAWEGAQLASDDPRMITREALNAFNGPQFICLSDFQSSPEEYRKEILNLQKQLVEAIGEPLAGRGTGPELAAFLEFTIRELNKAGNVKPEAAVDSVCRQLHFEPLIDALESKFVERLRSQDPGPRGLRRANYVKEALAEFDRKARQIPASASLKHTSRMALSKRLSRMQEVADIEDNEKENRDESDMMSNAASTTLGRGSGRKEACAELCRRIEASERWLDEFENHLRDQTEWLEQAIAGETNEFNGMELPQITVPDLAVLLQRPYKQAEEAINQLPDMPEKVDWDTLYALKNSVRQEVEELENLASQGACRSISTQIENHLAELDREITRAQRARLSFIERLEKRREEVEQEVRDTVAHERAERLQREAMSKQMIDGVVRWMSVAQTG